MEEIKYKVCTTCKKEFPMTTEFFPIRVDSKDGFRGRCRFCDRECKRKWCEKQPKKNTSEKQKERLDYLLTITSKVCTKCKLEKEFGEFNKAKKGKFGLESWCRVCKKIYSIEHKEEIAAYQKSLYEKNREKILVERKVYYENHKEEIAAYKKVYSKTHKEELHNKRKAWYEENREEKLAKDRIYREINKEKISKQTKVWYEENREERSVKDKIYRENHKEEKKLSDKRWRENNPDYEKNRKESDEQFRLSKLYRCRMHSAFKGLLKEGKTLDLLGCTWKQAVEHLESTFHVMPNGEMMTWDNQGNGGWSIDHIQPIANFDLTDPDQQRKAFHWSNLQALWFEDNLSKRDKPYHVWLNEMLNEDI